MERELLESIRRWDEGDENKKATKGEDSHKRRAVETDLPKFLTLLSLDSSYRCSSFLWITPLRTLMGPAHSHLWPYFFYRNEIFFLFSLYLFSLLYVVLGLLTLGIVWRVRYLETVTMLNGFSISQVAGVRTMLGTPQRLKKILGRHIDWLMSLFQSFKSDRATCSGSRDHRLVLAFH